MSGQHVPNSAAPAPGGGGDTASPVLPYLEETADRYGAVYAAGVGVTPVNEETLVLVGVCPRCGCACTFVHARRFFRRPPRRARSEGIPVYCTCATEHPGRPETESGCGAYWNVSLERS